MFLLHAPPDTRDLMDIKRQFDASNADELRRCRESRVMAEDGTYNPTPLQLIPLCDGRLFLRQTNSDLVSL